MSKRILKKIFDFRPLTPKIWSDFEKLFGERGACGGCWCMTWRLTRRQFKKQKGEGNKRAMKRIVSRGEVPGIIAYNGKEPVGWCSVAPRENFPVLDNSRVLARVDEKEVWSIVCLFISKAFRRKGLSSILLKWAAEYACKRGAKIVEGYPYDLGKQVLPDPFVWTGLAPAYLKAGFREVARRSSKRPIMRFFR